MTHAKRDKLKALLEASLHEWERAVADHNEFQALEEYFDDPSSDHPGNVKYDQQFKLLVFDTLTEIIRTVECPETTS